MPAPILPLIPYAAVGYCAALVATKIFPTPRSNPSSSTGPSSVPGFDGEDYLRGGNRHCGPRGPEVPEVPEELRPEVTFVQWGQPQSGGALPSDLPSTRNYQQYGVRYGQCGGTEPSSRPTPAPRFPRSKCEPTMTRNRPIIEWPLVAVMGNVRRRSLRGVRRRR